MPYAPPMNVEGDTEGGTPAGTGGMKRLTAFVVLSCVFLALSFFTPAREWFHVDRISRFSASLGAWGPVLLLAAGALTPLLFLPRWPIAFVCGLLYGTVWGSVLANVASTIGALVNYAMSRGLLAPVSARILKRRAASLLDIPREKAFLALLFLRAFPLSNFVATNILAGTLRIPVRTYLAATFLGMIPSTLMYAAWGKLMKKPSAGFYALAILTLVFIIGGTIFAQKRFLPWIRRRRDGTAGASEPGRPEGGT